MEVVHALPNRVRLKLAAVRNSSVARHVVECAMHLDGIHWVRANARCAGLVVRFDETKHTPSEILVKLREIVSEGYAQ